MEGVEEVRQEDEKALEIKLCTTFSHMSRSTYVGTSSAATGEFERASDLPKRLRQEIENFFSVPRFSLRKSQKSWPGKVGNERRPL
jgi:hypothetical protein